jgi:hypothetical protein
MHNQAEFMLLEWAVQIAITNTKPTHTLVLLDGGRMTEDRSIRPPSSVIRQIGMSDIQVELV